MINLPLGSKRISDSEMIEQEYIKLQTSKEKRSLYVKKNKEIYYVIFSFILLLLVLIFFENIFSQWTKLFYENILDNLSNNYPYRLIEQDNLVYLKRFLVL